MDDRQLTITQIADIIDEPRGTISQWVFRGQFPPHDGVTGITKWWRPSTIDEWDKERKQT